eukprot:10455885-Alexandrium_andersonii.AAC.1
MRLPTDRARALALAALGHAELPDGLPLLAVLAGLAALREEPAAVPDVREDCPCLRQGPGVRGLALAGLVDRVVGLLGGGLVLLVGDL